MNKLGTIAVTTAVLGACMYAPPADAEIYINGVPVSGMGSRSSHQGITFRGPLSRSSGMTGAHQRALARNGGVDRYKGALIWNDGRGMSTRGLGLSSGWERHVWRQNRKMAYANDNCRYPTYQGHGCQTLNGKPIGPTNELRYLEF